MSDELARKKLTELKERTDLITDAELDDYWATLKPATIDGMIGEWKGDGFNTGHKLNDALKEARWFGKTFNSAADGKPLICLDADGKKFSNVELATARPACGWKHFAVRSPPPWSTTVSRRTITSNASTTTPSWALWTASSPSKAAAITTSISSGCRHRARM